MIHRSLAVLFLSLAARPAAGDIRIGLPLACDPAETCAVRAHVDHDPGPGAADYRCGPHSRDGLEATEFIPLGAATPNVLAAAPGTVRAIRENRPDTAPPGPADCGNGVMVDHGGGWMSRYCHLARGSIAVAPGMRVSKGTVLGRIGTSGGADRPLLGFELRHRGTVIDPFAPADPITCDGPPPRSLWQAPPPYPGP